MSNKPVNETFEDRRTPCVGICSTVYGDTVCRGCKRTYEEVIHWNEYSDQYKYRIWQRLEAIAQETVSLFFERVDASLLKSKLDKYQVRYVLGASSALWVFSLLRQGSEKIRSLSAYGLFIKQKYVLFSPTALLEAMEKESYQRAVSSYENRQKEY